MKDPLQTGAIFWQIQYNQLTLIIKGQGDPQTIHGQELSNNWN